MPRLQMSITCVQPANTARITQGISRQLYTSTASAQHTVWENYLVIPSAVHKFFTQFCTPIMGIFTDTAAQFYTYSTAPITKTT